MSEIQQITDYSFTLERILEQYKNSPRLKGIIDAMNDQADDLESALFEIRDEFYLSTAVGVQLNVIGVIFDVPRNGATDSVYRSLIQTKAGLVGSGEPEKIIEALRSLYGGTFVKYFPGYPAIPASYYVNTDAVIALPELEAISGAGIQPYLAFYALFEDGFKILFEDGDAMLFSS